MEKGRKLNLLITFLLTMGALLCFAVTAECYNAEYEVTMTVGETITITIPDSASGTTFHAYNCYVSDDTILKLDYTLNTSTARVTALKAGKAEVTGYFQASTAYKVPHQMYNSITKKWDTYYTTSYSSQESSYCWKITVKNPISREINASTNEVNIEIGTNDTETVYFSTKQNPCYFSTTYVSGDSNCATFKWGAWENNGDIWACPLKITGKSNGTLQFYVELHEGETKELLARTSNVRVNVTTAPKIQSMKVSVKEAAVSYSKVKSTNQTIKKDAVFNIKNAKGKVTFTRISGSGKLSISKSGVITLKKGAKKGVYTMKVKVKAAGDAEYKAAAKTVNVKVRVK